MGETVIKSDQPICEPMPRLLVIDYFRGLAVLLMLIYDYVPFFTGNVPRMFQHGRTDFLLLGDLVAPFFLFIMGVGLSIAACRRRARGRAEIKIFREVLWRAFLLVLIGLLIDETRAPLLGSSFGIKWGVLETLGVSYLLSYFVMLLPNKVRFAAVAVMLAAHTYFSNIPSLYATTVNTFAHGGPFSAISYSTVTIFGAIVGERLHARVPNFQRYLLIRGGVLILIGNVVGQITGLTKTTVTAGYVLIGAGAAMWVFLLLYHLVEYAKVKSVIAALKPLQEFGRSALTAFVLQYLVAAYFIWYFHKYGKAEWEVGIPLGFFMVFVVWLIVRFLNRRNLAIRV